MDMEAVANEVLASELNEEVQLMKKKIQLSEGQRRAEYEEFDAERKRLAGRIRTVRKDLREVTATRPSKHVDVELLKKSGKPIKELKSYLGKTHEEVEQILDLQCIDLKKKLDLLKYEIAQKSERLEGCIKEMKELKSENETETLILIQPSESRVTKLENKIHETSLHLQEMRHMEKKYSKMRQSLLDDRVFFQSTLDRYEEEIAKQAKEIHHLQSVRDEAVRLRDKTKRKLSRLEALVVAQGIEREQELRELKRRVEEGRACLERVERSLVPSGGKVLQAQDSGELGDTGLSTEQLAKEALLEKLARIKEVTGAKDEEDILQKLRIQKETKERLLRLKDSIENEKKKMELKKEQLEAELEAIKFSEVKDNEQNEEEIEILEKEIAKAEEEVNEQTLLLDCEKAELKELKLFICHLIHLLKLMEGETASKPTNKSEEKCADLIDELKMRFNAMMVIVKESSSQALIEAELIDELFAKELETLELSSKKHEGESEKPAEEIPDVPTRDFLKRQSQIIVETQGKRKGGYPKETVPQSYR